MKKGNTSFQVINLNKPEKGADGSAAGLEQPVLVSFPHNIPPAS